MTAATPVLLVADDDQVARELLAETLSREGYRVRVAGGGQEALRLAGAEPFDMALVDLRMPDLDGLGVLKQLATIQPGLPVVILTAFATVETAIEAVNAGAFDYLSKPFRMEEVLARLRALIRRAHGQATPEIAVGDVVLDPRLAKVTRGGQVVRLTSHEYRVLSYLMHQRGRVVPQTELVDHIYAQASDRDSNTVEVFVARLRRKLGVVD